MSKSDNSMSLPQELTKLSKSDLYRRDVFGRTLLHIIILANRHDLLRNLLKNKDIKSIINLTDYENGWNILHYIFYYKKVSCYKVVLEYLRSQSISSTIVVANNTLIFDLLKTKDRNKLTPLQLISNDFKDLLWIPEYINEKDEYHFTYRFKSSPEEDETTKKKASLRSIPHNWWNESRGGSEIFMYGSNKNNNLGLGDSTDRSLPTKLPHECFKLGEKTSSIYEVLTKPRYNIVRLSKYHSMVLTHDGLLHSCGIGSRGRLGHGQGDMKNYFRFKKVDFFDELKSENVFIKDIVISNYHSLVLTSTNEIYTWGQNDFNQLGYSSSNKDLFEPMPRQVSSGDLKKRNFSSIRGVAVSKNHSVAFSKNSLYFWGLNIGQMGINLNSIDVIEHRVNGILYKGQIQSQPREVKLREDIKLVETCETCTCVITMNNEVHVYYQNQHIKLPKVPPRGAYTNFDHFKPSKLTEASSIKKVCMKSHEFVALLLESGDIMSFSLSNNDTRNLKYQVAWKAYDIDMSVCDIDVSYDGSMILCTRNGSTFIKSNESGRKQRANSMTESVLITKTRNKFKKIESLNKVVKVCCDDSFASFCFMKDDVDLIALKLQKNEFFMDIEYLSDLKEVDLYRKQDQLLDIDHELNCYITDFFYPFKSEFANEDDNFLGRANSPQIGMEDSPLTNSKDVLHEKLSNKYNFRANKRPTDSFQRFVPSQTQELIDFLKCDEAYLIKEFNQDSINSDKNYDTYIKLEHNPDVSIGIHKLILMKRAPLSERLFASDGNYIYDEGVEIRHKNGEIIFKSDINLKAVLIFVHYLYTNEILKIWDDYPSGIHCPPDITAIEFTFSKLINYFGMNDVLRNSTVNTKLYITNIGKMLQGCDDGSNEGDVTFRLKDGELYAHSSILIARSAFFETILSNRWDNGIEEVGKKEVEDEEKFLNFENISKSQFQIVLNYLYGTNDAELFNYHLKDIKTLSDTDDFINNILELIEIADELLLIPLKNLCQLALKDLITTENVMILLIHAEYLSCTKLFMNCCWFIYNNLESLILDNFFKELDFEILQKLETQFRIFTNCKYNDYVIGEKGEINEKIGTNWFEENSTEVVEQFIKSSETYNQNFMSDKKGFCSFELSIDVKQDKVLEGTKKKGTRKSHSSRKSSVVANNDLIDFRKTSTVLNNSNQEFAVDDEEFEVVTHGRRRKSTKSYDDISLKTPSRSSSIVDVLNANPVKSRSPSVSFEKSSVPKERKASGELLSSKSPTPIAPTPTASPPIPVSGLSPYSNWANRSAHTAEKAPVAPKLKKFSFTKISQKERKKLMHQDNDVEPLQGNSKSVNANNPWGNKQPLKAKIDESVKARLNASAISSSFISTPMNQVYSTPSLTEIMIHESLKLEREQLKDQKQTLQEIQQEQEFAKWWEEEAARVQQLMGQDVGPSKKPAKSKGKPYQKQRSLDQRKTRTKSTS